MAKLVSDDPGAASTTWSWKWTAARTRRTIRQRLRIPAAQWRTFAATVSAGAAPDTVVNAYLAWQGFGTGWRRRMPMRCPLRLDDPRTQPVAPSADWLSVNIATGEASAESGA